MKRNLLPPKIISVISIVVLLSLSVCFLTSCGSKSIEKDYLAMDTVMEIKLYDGDSSLLDKCGEIIDSVEKKFSVTDANSYVYSLNSGATVTDSELISLLNECKRISALTDGAFDTTVYPIVDAYGFTDRNFRLPEEAEIAALLSCVGYDKIILDNEQARLVAGTKIDLGGIAKGYCSDLLKNYLVENGVTSGVINLGGNVMTIGKKQGKNWRVAIADPYGNGYIGILDISDAAVVTSGLYERYFEKDGVRYGHIIDPYSGKPVNNGFLSVTVVGQNGTLCDALSTALFVMGPEKAEQFVIDHDIDAIFLTDDNKIRVTKNLDDIFELYGDYKNSTKVVIGG